MSSAVFCSGELFSTLMAAFIPANNHARSPCVPTTIGHRVYTRLDPKSEHGSFWIRSEDRFSRRAARSRRSVIFVREVELEL